MTQIGNTGLRIRLAQLNFKIGDFEGNIFKLTYDMKKDFEKPLKY